MAKAQILAATTVQTSNVSDDGTNLSLNFAGATGPLTINMPMTEINKLLMLAVTAKAIYDRAQTKNPNVRFAVPVENWEISGTTDNFMVMTYVLPGGAEQSFRISVDQAPHMAKVIADVIAGR